LNARQYCENAERAERRRKALARGIVVREDHSPLVSLKDAGFRLMFEPSMMTDYGYRVREAVCEKIGRISRRLEEQDRILIIRSVWRSFEHQRRLWNHKVAEMRREHPDRSDSEIDGIVSRFIAPPRESMHATGGAVDALIYDTPSHRVLDFGNNDGLHLELDETCYPLHPDIPDTARENRRLLIGLFEDEDFVVDFLEYWHFDFGNVSWATRRGRQVAPYGVIEEVSG
jgi:D-alanyl-D-alanine dipeptidase